MGIEKDIINLLIKKHICNTEDIHTALNIQKKYPAKLGTVLLNSGIVSEKDYIEILSELLNLPIFVYKENDLPEKVILKGINDTYFKDKFIIPWKINNNKLYILINYFINYENIADLYNLIDKEIVLYLSTNEYIDKIKELYSSYNDEQHSDFIDVDEDDEIEKLKELASEAPVIKLINTHFNSAVTRKASDIHYESYQKGIRVRFRVDGKLINIDNIALTYKKAIIARLKLLAKMDISENRLPQDGRMSIKVSNQEIDIRSSSAPTAFGESFVLRLLFKQTLTYSISYLDFYEDHIKLLEDITNKKNGVFLTTGPTGSGKTTTLYALLNDMNNEEVKIITVEDPVEYELEGINQIQIKSKIDFNFSNALRSILRQDPDTIMIGEIRDKETARIAIQASLTGHLVLSTLHTNSALGAIRRLLDMGIEFYLLQSSINALMAQRLVRKLCSCKESYSLDENVCIQLNIVELLEKYKFIETINVFRAKGCKNCNNTGYKGRLPVAEIVPFTQLVQSKFENDKSFDDLNSLNYRSLKEDAVLKFLDGKTSYEEIINL